MARKAQGAHLGEGAGGIAGRRGCDAITQSACDTVNET
jgi:hypothetical protein